MTWLLLSIGDETGVVSVEPVSSHRRILLTLVFVRAVPVKVKVIFAMRISAFKAAKENVAKVTFFVDGRKVWEGGVSGEMETLSVGVSVIVCAYTEV